MKTIKGNLELKKDTTFNESIMVEGNITGIFDLTVKGNIDAGDIDARNINAWDIDAGDISARNIDAENINACYIDAGDINVWDINAWNIDAENINAGDINACYIICVSRNKRKKDSKTIAYSLVTDRFNREKKEQMPEEAD